MAWDNDTVAGDTDDLDSKPADNLSPKKSSFVGSKTKIKGAGKSFGKGIGTRKSTSAPRGSGRKGGTNKSNALKGA